MQFEICKKIQRTAVDMQLIPNGDMVKFVDTETLIEIGSLTGGVGGSGVVPIDKCIVGCNFHSANLNRVKSVLCVNEIWAKFDDVSDYLDIINRNAALKLLRDRCVVNLTIQLGELLAKEVADEHDSYVNASGNLATYPKLSPPNTNADTVMVNETGVYWLCNALTLDRDMVDYMVSRTFGGRYKTEFPATLAPQSISHAILHSWYYMKIYQMSPRFINIVTERDNDYCTQYIVCQIGCKDPSLFWRMFIDSIGMLKYFGIYVRFNGIGFYTKSQIADRFMRYKNNTTSTILRGQFIKLGLTTVEEAMYKCYTQNSSGAFYQAINRIVNLLNLPILNYKLP